MSYTKAEKNFGIAPGTVKKIQAELLQGHFRFLSQQPLDAPKTISAIKEEIKSIATQLPEEEPPRVIDDKPPHLLSYYERPQGPNRRLPSKRSRDHGVSTELQVPSKYNPDDSLSIQLQKATQLGIYKYKEHKLTGQYARKDPGLFSGLRHTVMGKERASALSDKLTKSKDALAMLEKLDRAGQLRYENNSLTAFILDEYSELLKHHKQPTCKVIGHYNKKILHKVINQFRELEGRSNTLSVS